LKNERIQAAKTFSKPEGKFFKGGKKKLIQAVHDSLYASKICSYAQGFALMKAMSIQEQWNLNLGEIAMIWRGGCIIRARFLQRIKEAYDRNPKLENLLLDSYFADVIQNAEKGWRWIISQAALAGIPIPAFSASLAYYDSYRSQRLPANLLQAQRDYFGSHTYQRTDQPEAKKFHFDWVGNRQQTEA
jgi:6-phosphogluconate dehydrogenase